MCFNMYVNLCIHTESFLTHVLIRLSDYHIWHATFAFFKYLRIDYDCWFFKKEIILFILIINNN